MGGQPLRVRRVEGRDGRRLGAHGPADQHTEHQDAHRQQAAQSNHLLSHEQEELAWHLAPASKWL
jgi:hypothetical protein